MEVDFNFVKGVIAELTLENRLLQAQVVALQQRLSETQRPKTDKVDETPSI